MCFVNFNWKNEISVIKQSLPAFICIILPLLLGVLPFFLEYKKNTIYLEIEKAKKKIKKIVGEEKLQELTTTNAKQILENN